MATHKSAEKRARQAVKKQTRNSAVKNSAKSYEKTLVKALDAKTKETPALLKKYVSEISKAAQKGVINKKTASRKISRLSARVSAQTGK